MTKKELAALESLFQWEIDSAFDQNLLQPKIRPPKLAQKLIDDGMIEEIEITLPGWFQLNIVSHTLTHRGRIHYCEWAASQPGCDF